MRFLYILSYERKPDWWRTASGCCVSIHPFLREEASNILMFIAGEYSFYTSSLTRGNLCTIPSSFVSLVSIHPLLREETDSPPQEPPWNVSIHPLLREETRFEKEWISIESFYTSSLTRGNNLSTVKMFPLMVSIHPLLREEAKRKRITKMSNSFYTSSLTR